MQARRPASWLVVAMLAGLPAVGRGQPFHGAAVLYGCTSCKEVGEATDCLLEFRNLDSYGDGWLVNDASDVVESIDGFRRVPAAGHLPIVAVGGTSTCTVGGALPCTVGAGGSVTFRSNQFVLDLTESQQVWSTGLVFAQDVCSQPGGQSSCSTNSLAFPGFPSRTEVCFQTDECTDAVCAGPDRWRLLCTHPPSPDGTPCLDRDGNACTFAGCEAGTCDQSHPICTTTTTTVPDCLPPGRPPKGQPRLPRCKPRR
ncbi:MAG TPA: hypothetical protein VKA21_13760 [Candidatus Binatia bacterium]|nr:hypothetical protein [Candidatus Binatia bacterium]